MAKIFSILTLIVAGVAIFLALEGDKRVKDMQKAGRDTVAVLKLTEKRLQTTEAELTKTQADLTTTRADLEKARTELTAAQAKEKEATANYTAAKADLDKIKADFEGMKKSLEEMFPGVDFAKGIAAMKEAIDQLKAKTTAQETEIADLTKTKQNLESTVADLTATKTKQEGVIADQGTKIVKYRDNIMQKGIRGRVEAVNAGWGFCVVSIGDKQGAAANKVLIVVRNGQSIGKVKITNVEATQSVADILPNTFVKGMFVAPGDSVIYTGEDKANVEEATTAPGNIVNPPLPPR